MPRGGKRKGAGRPKGSGKYGAPTKAMRVPENFVERIADFIERNGDVYPFFPNQVQAGFPATIEDQPSESLDLNNFLIANPPATFFMKATGDSMEGAGIYGDDILVVDRSAEASSGDIVIAVVNNEFAVKRLGRRAGKVVLHSENPKYPSITVPEGSDVAIWGVVKFVIHPL